MQELFRIKRALSAGRYECADEGGDRSGLELLIQQQIETELERVLVYYLLSSVRRRRKA